MGHDLGRLALIVEVNVKVKVKS